MRKTAKIVLLVLMLALVIGAIAIVASAANEEAEAYDLADEIASASPGATVKLTGDAYIDSTITLTKFITIDLNGHKLTTKAANAFTINGKYALTVTGEGTLELWGSLMESTTSTAGTNLKVSVLGTGEGIVINHLGTVGTTHRIITAKVGLYTFKNVEINSTAPVLASNCVQGSNMEAFFETTPFKSGTTLNTTGAVFDFENCSFRCETSMPTGAAQGGQAFISLAGNGYLNMKNCYVRNAGSFAQVGYSKRTTSGADDASGNIFTVEDSVINVGVTYNTARHYGIYGHQLDGGDDSYVVGTMTFKNSSFVSESYRAAIFSATTKVNNRAKIVLDNSLFANTRQGASTSNNAGTGLLVRCCDLYATNGSALASMDKNLTGGSADYSGSTPYVYAEEGTRFSLEAVGTGATKNGTTTKLTTSAIYFDPIGNPEYPWVYSTTLTSDYLPEGASSMEYTGFHTFGGYGGSAYGYWPDKKGTPSYDEFKGMVQLDSKAGSILDANYGGNNAFKFWMTPPADDPTATTRIAGNSSRGDDTYFIFGDANGYSTASHKIAQTAVAVLQFDFATDSEIGFPDMRFAFMSRSSSNGPKEGDKFLYVYRDGTLVNGSLDNYDTTASLDADGWNRFTIVFETGFGGVDKASVYLNGKLLGTSKNAYGTDGAYIQGVRMNLEDVTHKVGSSFMVDNLLTVNYAAYKTDASGNDITDHSAYLPADYNSLPKAPVNNDMTVNGIPYADINEAITDASASGSVVKLYGDITEPQVVTADGKVKTNGYKFKVADGSTSYSVYYDDEGNIAYYDFVKDYADTELEYLWYNGPVSSDSEVNAANFANTAYYVSSTFKMNETPSIPSTVSIATAYNYAEKVAYVVTDKWINSVTGNQETFTAINADMVRAIVNQHGGKVYLTPDVEASRVPYAFDVVNESGAGVKAGFTDAEFTSAFTSLSDGQTLTLYKDMTLTKLSTIFKGKSTDAGGVTIDNDYTEAELATMQAASDVICFDLNGHTMRTSGTNSYIAAVSYNMTLNIYSSQPGGYISNHGYITSGTAGLIRQRAFAIYYGGSENNTNKLNNYNAHLNIGAYTKADGTVVPGSNLSLSAGYNFDGITGDSSCSMTVDGLTVSRGKEDSDAIFTTRYYDGKITVKNCLLITKSGTIMCMRNNANTPTVLFDNCIAVVDPTATGTFFCKTSSHTLATGSFTLRNVITNAEINAPSGANIIIEENVAASYIDPSILGEGIVTAIYNVPMTLAPYTSEKIIGIERPVFDSTTGIIDYNQYLYIVNNGCAGLVPEALSTVGYIELPVLPMMTVREEDVATVTFIGADGNVISSIDYAPGAIATVPEIEQESFNSISAVRSWTPAVPERVEGTVTYTISDPVIKGALEGCLVNLTLYSDFRVNLYVPKVYESYITSVSAADKALTGYDVVIGGKDYLKYVVSSNCETASLDTVFNINLSEGGYTATSNVTMSVLRYAEAVLGGNYANADKALVKHVVNYVNAALSYAGKTDTSISNLAANYPAPTVERTYTNTSDLSELSGVFKEVTVVLGTAPAFRFTVADGYTGTIKIAGRTYNVTESANRTITVNTLRAFDFLEPLEIEADGKSGTYTYETFYAYHLANSKDNLSSTQAASKAALGIISALYDYASYAKAYKNVSSNLGGDTVLNLISNNSANFNVIISSELDSESRALVEQFVESLRAAGVDVNAPMTDVSSSTIDCEIIFGTGVAGRENKYVFDVSALGHEGYVIKVIGNKIVVAGGTAEVTKSAINTFISEVFNTGSYSDVNVDRTYENVYEVDYAIDSVTIGGTDLSEYVIVYDYNGYDKTYTFNANNFRNTVFSNTGYFLDVVNVESADSYEKRIFIRCVSDAGEDGFRAYVDNAGDLFIDCEFPARFNTAYDAFMDEFIYNASGDVILPIGYEWTMAINTVCYSDFGAVGDGVTLDYEAIYNTHVYANRYGYKVLGTPGATYYINVFTKAIPVKTDVDFMGATFHIDDRGDAIYNNSGLPLFLLDRDHVGLTLSGSDIYTDLGDVTLSPGDTKLDWLVPYLEAESYVRFTNNHKDFIRHGSNINSGNNRTDIIIVDVNGNVSEETPVVFEFATGTQTMDTGLVSQTIQVRNFTSIEIQRVDDKPITVENGVFERDACKVLAATDYKNVYHSYKRGFQISRSNVTIRDLSHELLSEPYMNTSGYGWNAEGTKMSQSYPYYGFLFFQGANNVHVEDCILTGHTTYYEDKSASSSTPVAMGTYDLVVEYSANISFENVTQRRDIADYQYWGIMSSNGSKNMSFNNCVLSRFDAHRGFWNATLTNSEFGQYINVVGGGKLYMENVKRHTGNYFIGLRGDYGATFNGDIEMVNCSHKGIERYRGTPTTKKVADVRIINSGYSNVYKGAYEEGNAGAYPYLKWNFGYTCYMPQNIIVDNFKVDTGVTIYMFNALSNAMFEKPADFVQSGEVESELYYNQYQITKSITIRNMSKPAICPSTGSSYSIVWSIPVKVE